MELKEILSWFNSESQSQKEAYSFDSEISNAKKVIPPTKPASGRKHKLLLAVKTVCIVVAILCHMYDIICLKIHLYLPIQLPESWKSCSSHPNNKVVLFTQLLQKMYYTILTPAFMENLQEKRVLEAIKMISNHREE